MKIKFIFLFSFFLKSILLISFISSSYATDIFLPKGCPDNSYCSPEKGNLHQQWEALITQLSKWKQTKQSFDLLKKFFKQYGLGTTVYWQGKYIDALPSILWDSKCTAHTKLGPAIYEGFSMIFNTSPHGIPIVYNHLDSSRKLYPGILLRPIILEEKEKKETKVRTYFLPQDAVPYGLDHQKIKLLRETGGYYYFLEISSDGQWGLAQYQAGHKALSEKSIECPTHLKKIMDENYNKQKVYEYYYCKELKDLGTSPTKNFIALIPQVCQK